MPLNRLARSTPFVSKVWSCKGAACRSLSAPHTILLALQVGPWARTDAMPSCQLPNFVHLGRRYSSIQVEASPRDFGKITLYHSQSSYGRSVMTRSARAVIAALMWRLFAGNMPVQLHRVKQAAGQLQ